MIIWKCQVTSDTVDCFSLARLSSTPERDFFYSVSHETNSLPVWEILACCERF
jgi:hypothetical protein